MSWGNGGTSAATAITSAAAAHIWSAHPAWTANQVLNVLFDTGRLPPRLRPSLRRQRRLTTPPWQAPVPRRTTTTNWSTSSAEWQ
ncbi:S8 family serine peptidase [Streptomyces sp. NPDC048438]|uniref:S8 family serine peptidase n=1 Tax=Streptomyces sp. NPDC048438 TaxID=3365551 RepID=UPI003710FB0C